MTTTRKTASLRPSAAAAAVVAGLVYRVSDLVLMARFEGLPLDQLVRYVRAEWAAQEAHPSAPSVAAAAKRRKRKR